MQLFTFPLGLIQVLGLEVHMRQQRQELLLTCRIGMLRRLVSSLGCQGRLIFNIVGSTWCNDVFIPVVCNLFSMNLAFRVRTGMLMDVCVHVACVVGVYGNFQPRKL